MERLRQLIKEALSTPPKKDKCNCGCHDCDNVGNTGVVLNESLVKKDILSENLRYHVDKQLPLTENTFRYGSKSFLNLWSEARYLYLREIIHVNDDDKEILLETNLGEYGIYESVEFEGEEYDIIGRDGDWVYLRSIYDTMTGNKEIKVKEKDVKILEKKVPLDLPMLEEDKLDEAEDKKKTPPIGKPKRGGSKKFYVYVRDKGKIKKVSFGGTTGLSVKINDPKARQAFAKRHRCSEKTDRTKPSYWSCRIGRYWKQLGGAKNFSGFW